MPYTLFLKEARQGSIHEVVTLEYESAGGGVTLTLTDIPRNNHLVRSIDLGKKTAITVSVETGEEERRGS